MWVNLPSAIELTLASDVVSIQNQLRDMNRNENIFLKVVTKFIAVLVFWCVCVRYSLNLVYVHNLGQK